MWMKDEKKDLFAMTAKLVKEAIEVAGKTLAIGLPG